jgi:hypothetical protein
LQERVAAADAARIAMQGMVEQFAGQMRDTDEIMKSERARSDALLADATARAEAAIAAERQRADGLRAQIDELNAEMMVMRAEADRELADERQRADRMSEQVDAGHHDLDAARTQAERLQHDLSAAVAIADEAVRAVAELRREDSARQARELVARLRAVWRGE